MTKELKRVLCHPEKEYYAKGLCQSCYLRNAHEKYKLIPGYNKKKIQQSKEWRLRNLERARRTDYLRHTVRNFGMTQGEYQKRWDEQNGLCKICSMPSVSGKRLHVDHNHKTGKVRDLLCHHCNAGLGQFKEDIVVMEKAIQYLKKYKEEHP